MTNDNAASVFDRDGWWDESCRDFASLRAVNEVRLSILRRWMADWFPTKLPSVVADLGCGGGLMSVALARTGARVVGVDRAHNALRSASQQAEPRAHFVCGDIAAPGIADETVDLAMLCDVVEHLSEPRVAVAAAARMLRPGGALFVNTINRTMRARVLAVWLGEGLGLIPRGTHDARMFVRPSELRDAAAAAGQRATHACGERPRLLASLRSRCVQLAPARSMAVSYCMGFVKEAR